MIRIGTKPHMALPHTNALPRAFLGVEKSATGRAWRDRLDERGTGARAGDRAAARRAGIAGARAGRARRRAGEVAAYLDPTIKRLMPDPHTLTEMAGRGSAHRRCRSIARRERRDLRRLRRRRRDRLGAAGRYLRHCGLDPIVHIPDRIFEGYGPNVDAIRCFAERGVKLLVTVDCGTTSIEPLDGGQEARPRRRRDRSSSGRRGTAAGGRHRQSEPRRRSLRPRPSRRGRPGVPHAGGAQPRIAPARFLDGDARRSPICCRCLHLVALGTVADVVPLKGLNRAFVAKGLIALRRREHVGADRADGCGAAVRSAGAVASRLSARARASMPAAASAAPISACGCCWKRIRPRPRASPPNSTGSTRERRQIEIATVAQAEAEAMAALGLEEKGAVVVTARRGLASRRGRPGGGAAEGALRPAGLRDCA